MGPALGKPGEARLVADGLAMLDWFASTLGQLETSRIGWSPGGACPGIAVQVCAESARCAGWARGELVSPYYRLIEPGAVQLLCNANDAERRSLGRHVRRIACPVLLVLGSATRPCLLRTCAACSRLAGRTQRSSVPRTATGAQAARGPASDDELCRLIVCPAAAEWVSGKSVA